jgi:hypothetical protein
MPQTLLSKTKGSYTDQNEKMTDLLRECLKISFAIAYFSRNIVLQLIYKMEKAPNTCLKALLPLHQIIQL